MVDRDELEAWLNTRSREEALLIEQRAALRIFPLCAQEMAMSQSDKPDLNLTVALRCYLTAGVACRIASTRVADAASRACSATVRAFGFAATSYHARAGAFPAFGAAASLAFAADDARTASLSSFKSNAFAFAVSAAKSWDDSSYASFLSDAEKDVALLESKGDPLSAPLWHFVPPVFVQELEKKALQTLTRETGDPNSFWHRWWRGAVSGQWLDWNLQRDIALLPDDIWQEGPKAVLAAIAEIEARHDLLRQVTDLRQQVEALRGAVLAPGAAIAHRGHNHPPELVDLPAELVAHTVPLLRPLQQAEVELAKHQPDKTVLRRLAGALASFADAVLRYCGKTADSILQEAAKSVGQQAGPLVKWLVLSASAKGLFEGVTHYLSTFGP
ncbi:MAG: hypothetical protein JNN06_08430 [Gemmobacter sp.]|uniref:hypothetical protein n=1 Tax=Gemmobacter sp. TaxID=1898957 RepID=UPI001A47E410|nr:hypothetical protein [Gemmobacter sp.]MBL8562291.1 hypothetical protein [Gemmobacter sp.]